MFMHQKEFSHSTILYKAPIMYLVFKKDAELDVKEVREMIKAAEELAGKKPYLLMSDVRNDVTISEAARKISASKEEAPFVLANAILTDNIALRITANFFIQINKPHFPVKVFSNADKAHKWLMEFDPDKDVTKLLDEMSE